jgi:hypothetical protein
MINGYIIDGIYKNKCKNVKDNMYFDIISTRYICVSNTDLMGHLYYNIYIRIPDNHPLYNYSSYKFDLFEENNIFIPLLVDRTGKSLFNNCKFLYNNGFDTYNETIYNNNTYNKYINNKDYYNNGFYYGINYNSIEYNYKDLSYNETKHNNILKDNKNEINIYVNFLNNITEYINKE